MSSRQLKKLRQLQELQQAAKPDSDPASDDEPVAPKPRPSVFSGFAALGDGGDDEGEDDDDDDNDTPSISAVEQPRPQTAANTQTKSKKKPKKKKKARKPQPSTEKEAAEPEDGLDEIDRALKEIDLGKRAAKNPNSVHQSVGQEDTHGILEVEELLSINPTHLKVMNEMRNLFAREALQASNSDSDPQRQQQPAEDGVSLEQFLKGRPGQSISEVLLRRNPFVQGKVHWPKAPAGGLRMKEIGPGVFGPRQASRIDSRFGEAHGTTEFAFAHDGAYEKMETTFFGLVQMHDPMQLVHFLFRNPYHVSSLIQVSKFAAQRDQNLALGSELCERALFTFGRVTLSAFRKKLLEGRARMDFRRPENRQFWLAGYHYIRSLILKGTHRTALEWAKLFLSLSPEDDYGMISFIHPLAIRAREASWLLRLFANRDFVRMMEGTITEWNYILQTRVLAMLQVGDTPGAKEELANGMRSLPWLYCSLFSALDMDAPKSIWAVKPPSPEHELFTELYLHLTKDLWGHSDTKALLRQVATELPKPDAAVLNPPQVQVPLRLARFVYLLDKPALMSLVPREMLHASPNYDFDPLPPPQAENIFSSEGQRGPWQPQDRRSMGALAAGAAALAAAVGAGNLPFNMGGEAADLEEEWEAAAALPPEFPVLGAEADPDPPRFPLNLLRLLMGPDYIQSGDVGDEDDHPDEDDAALDELYMDMNGYNDDDFDDVDEFEGDDDFGDQPERPGNDGTNR